MEKLTEEYCYIENKYRPILVDEYGSIPGAIEEMESWIFDSLCPAVCLNGCGYAGEYEQDQREGWCECCGEGKAVSLAIMLGVI